jgi:hypothetical protein
VKAAVNGTCGNGVPSKVEIDGLVEKLSSTIFDFLDKQN